MDLFKIFRSLADSNPAGPPRPPPRPLANYSLQQKTSSHSPDRRKVSFQEGPPTDTDNASAKRTPPAGGKSSKWQPLTTVEPSPVSDNDPFSLGDSDDEKDTKSKDQTTTAESEQIKKATAESMSGEIGSSKDDSKPEEQSK